MQSVCIRNTNHWLVWVEVSIVNCGNRIEHIEFVEIMTEFLKVL